MHKPCLRSRAYDTDAIVEKATKQGMEVVIPPKKNRLVQRQYDRHLYKLRHLIENTFLKLKQWRGIATRYARKLFLLPRCGANPMHCSVG